MGIALKLHTVHQFHPLHVIPSHPKETIPRPLLRIVLPDVGLELDASHPDETAPLPDPVIGKPLDENKSEAERMREMMKRDALDELNDLDGEEEGEKEGKVAMKNAIGMKHDGLNGASGPPAADTSDPSEAPIDWYSHVSGVNRVLAMDVSVSSSPPHQSTLIKPPSRLLPTSHSSSLRYERTTFTVFGVRPSTDRLRRWMDLGDVPVRKRMLIESGEYRCTEACTGSSLHVISMIEHWRTGPVIQPIYSSWSLRPAPTSSATS